jgi:hypothetical protein
MTIITEALARGAVLLGALVFSLAVQAGGEHPQGADAGPADHAEAPTLVYTDYTASTELFVEFPPLVVDRAGIFGSFGRSADLTRGSRWRIFGLILLGYIAMAVIAALFGLLAVGGSAGSVVAGDGGFNISGLIAGVVIDTALAIIAAVGVSVLFVHLREIKDGTRVNEIGDVFS